MTPSFASAARTTALLLLAALSGCAADPPDPVSISYWQRSLEEYVWDRGNGDPIVLRDTSWDDVHKGFAVISDAMPDRSTDAIGLLLAHRRIADKPYFLFMLAIIKSDRVEDLRPVALSVEQARFHWVIGAENQPALQAYRHSTGAARFPAADDPFQLTVTGTHVTVLHPESGAKWELAVPLRLQ